MERPEEAPRESEIHYTKSRATDTDPSICERYRRNDAHLVEQIAHAAMLRQSLHPEFWRTQIGLKPRVENEELRHNFLARS